MTRKVSVSKLIRRTHLFLALFLAPWVLMYALSTITMHHRVLFTGEPRRVDPGYEMLREEAYAPPFARDEDRQVAARRLLQDLDLEGAFTVRGSLEQGVLTILRNRPIRSYRITYETNTGTLRVERQRFGMAYFLEMLHRRRGYQQPFLGNDLWAFVVDAVILAMLTWAATGLWMWWELARTRRLGALCLGAGIACFLLFLLTL
jgi:hypothetical protein